MQKEALEGPSIQELDSSQLGHSTDMVGEMSINLPARGGAEKESPPPASGAGATDAAAPTPPGCAHAYAMCTLGGSLALYTGREKLWEVQVPHQLFSISKVDVTGNGSDEVVACAWDGTTLIVDSRQNMVRYHFEEDVCAFAAGTYAREAGVNCPCLVYVTLSGRVVIYYDILINSVATMTLSQVIAPVYAAHPVALATHFGVRAQGVPGAFETLSPAEKQSIQHELLYEHNVHEWTRRRKLLEAQIQAIKLQTQADEEP